MSNRQQRRHQQIKNVPSNNFYDVKTVQMLCGDAKQEGKQEAVVGLTAAVLLSLHDEFDFGKVRLQRVLSKIKNQFDCINARTVSLDDILKYLDEEFDIQIR